MKMPKDASARGAMEGGWEHGILRARANVTHASVTHFLYPRPQGDLKESITIVLRAQETPAT